jgi:hypothetical protein
MSQTMKNIAGLLVVVTLSYAGYLFYQQSNNSSLDTDGSGVFSEEKLAETQLFIERRILLDSVVLDTTVFDDPVFRSYQGINVPITESEVGRENPFGRVAPGSNLNRF